MITYYVCGVCGKRIEAGKATANGWLVATGYQPQGEMIIRCDEHNTKAAREWAEDRQALDPTTWDWES
jgi:hypothetical protein